MLSVFTRTSAEHTLPGVLAAIAFFVAALFPQNNPDTYGHLAQGRQIVEMGVVPQTDAFSFWEDKPSEWHNYEWLADVLLWVGYSSLGVAGLVLLKCVLSGLLGWLFLAVARRYGSTGMGSRWSEWITAAFLIASLCVVRVRLVLRPHFLGYIAVAILLLLLAKGLRSAARGERGEAMWTACRIALVHVLWVNSHGSHLLGIAIVGAFALAHVLRDSWSGPASRWCVMLLFLQLGVSGISPFGFGILADAIEHVLRPEYRALVSEWGGWSDEVPLVYTIVWFVCGTVLVLSLREGLRTGAIGLAKLFIVAGLLWMAYRSVRFNALLALLAGTLLVPLVAGGLEARLAAKFRPSIVFVALVAGLACAFSLSSLPRGMKAGPGESHLYNPHACAGWLRDHAPNAHLYAAMDDGWYVLFVSPQTKVILDGRVPYYGVEHVRRVAEALVGQRSLREEVDSAGANALLLRRTSSRYQKSLAGAESWDDWSVACVENRHALFVKDGLVSHKNLNLLPLRYDPAELVSTVQSKGEQAVLQQLQGLPRTASSSAYIHWVEATAELVTLTGGMSWSAGVPVAKGAQKAKLGRVEGLLDDALEDLGGLPAIELQHVVALSALCRLDEAEARLDKLRNAGGTREGILARVEIALRRGDEQPLQTLLSSASSDERVSQDPWLMRLQNEAPGQCR